MRLNLWSSPRNISTALMYAFAQRPDTRVVDEPLYAHYLRHQSTEAEHPGRDEILATSLASGTEIVKNLTTNDFGADLVVFKQMTHHLINFSLTDEVAMLGLPPVATPEIANVLLIRNPREILASFSKVVKTVTPEDIGLPQQYALFKRLTDHGKLTAVLDSQRLLLHPEATLRKLCDRIGKPFHREMLSWPPGPRPEDGVWAKYWYANVHKSTGFQPYQRKQVDLPPALEKIAVAVMPLYEEMLAQSL